MTQFRFVLIAFFMSLASVSFAQSCYSDYGCPFGHECVKAPLDFEGICMESVNRFGMPAAPTLPDPNSIQPNLNIQGDCMFDYQCPLGFACDQTYRVCIYQQPTWGY